MTEQVAALAEVPAVCIITTCSQQPVSSNSALQQQSFRRVCEQQCFTATVFVSGVLGVLFVVIQARDLCEQQIQVGEAVLLEDNAWLIQAFPSIQIQPPVTQR